MKIEIVEITDAKQIIEVQVILRQNDVAAVIAHVRRRFIPDWELVEYTVARALRTAADWLDAGPVSLRETGGQYVART